MEHYQSSHHGVRPGETESPLEDHDEDDGSMSADMPADSASQFSNFTEKGDEPDGHRPTLLDLQESRTRSRRNLSQVGGVSSSADTNLGRLPSRTETVLSHIRSRPVYRFTHPLAHVPTTTDDLVDFEGPDDPYHPLNWPTQKKALTTLLYGFVTMSATWASSSYSPATRLVARDFNVGIQVANLGTTLFLFGFGLGPLLWAPISEVFGRRIAVLVPMFVAICFSFGSATAKDLQTLMLTRFFGAFFASAPVTNTGGVLGDMYTPATRGIAMAGYAMAVVGGPVLGKFTLSCCAARH
jgi:MFS transporter, DHA1 family, multidrug resistance protein